MGLGAGGGVAGVDERARQVELGAVDGEHAMALPARPGALGTPQDLGLELLEDILVELGPGLAHGGVGDRLRLRQGHVEGAALGPQLGQRGGVALAAGGEHEAEHEQHHQQRVEHAAALLPAAVVVGGQGAERADQALPQGHEARVGGRGRGRGRLALAGPRAAVDTEVGTGHLPSLWAIRFVTPNPSLCDLNIGLAMDWERVQSLFPAHLALHAGMILFHPDADGPDWPHRQVTVACRHPTPDVENMRPCCVPEGCGSALDGKRRGTPARAQALLRRAEVAVCREDPARYPERSF